MDDGLSERGRCPVCQGDVPARDTVAWMVCACGTVLYPDPDHTPGTPPHDAATAWAWTGARWMVLHYEELP